MGAVFRWVKYIYEWCKAFVMGKLDAYLGGGLGYPVVYHVSKDGLDTNDGLSWAKAFLTIQHGLDAVGTLAGRGKGTVLVGPGAYTETLTTPLNDDGPFGTLLAASPSGISHGDVYVASEAAAEAWLTVRARGWRISGFEIACPTAEAGIKLDSQNVGCNAAYAQIDHCHFTGGLYGINAVGSAAPPFNPNYVTIKDNMFSMMQEAGARAITSTVGINCNIWVIENNIFIANINHIEFPAATVLQSATIKGNVFHGFWSPGGVVTQNIDLPTGAANVITQNHLGGVYSNAGGYLGGASDDWFGNFANVVGGVTQADPA